MQGSYIHSHLWHFTCSYLSLQVSNVFLVSVLMNTWENHHCEKHGNTQISPNLTHKLWKMLDPGMPGRSYQTKPGLPSSVSMLRVPVLDLIIETSAVWPWCRRSFQDICRGQWIIIAELTCGLFPMIFCMVFPSWPNVANPVTNPMYNLHASSLHSDIPFKIRGVNQCRLSISAI
jgi:hypothetical protein